MNAEYKLNDYVTFNNKIQRRAVGPELHRYDAGAGHRQRHASTLATQSGQLDRHASIRRAAIRSPRSWPTRPTRRSSSIPGRSATRGDRHRILARTCQHRQLYRPLFGGDRRRGVPTARQPGRVGLDPPNLLPFNTTPTLTGNPTVIPVDTKSGYLLETANYRDFIILNGGIRFDEYHVGATKGRTSDHLGASSGMFNYNGGVVIKPLPIASIYAAYGTSSEPVGAELDGTSANYGGLNPTSTVNQIFGPTQNRAEEVGTKWELFDRHLLATGGAVPDRRQKCARDHSDRISQRRHHRGGRGLSRARHRSRR